MTIGYTTSTYHSGAHFASLWDGLKDFGTHGEMCDSAGIHQTSGHTAGLRIRIVARLVDDDLLGIKTNGNFYRISDVIYLKSTLLVLPKEIITGRGLQCQHQTHIGAKETLVIGALLGVPGKEASEEVVSNKIHLQ